MVMSWLSQEEEVRVYECPNQRGFISQCIMFQLSENQSLHKGLMIMFKL